MIDLGNVYFCCDECPICEDLEYRLKLAEDGYGLQLEYCWCDKVCGKMYAYGYCPDSVSQKRKKSKIGKRRTGSAYRREMKKRKFERAKAIGDMTCNPAVGWVKSDFIDGEWVDGTYIKCPRIRKDRDATRDNRTREFGRWMSP
jgi:hypothetical protein